MGMIFNSTATLHIIDQLNGHFAEGTNYRAAKAGDPAKFAKPTNDTTHKKSVDIGVVQNPNDHKGNIDTWQYYLDHVIDLTPDPNNPGQSLAKTILNQIVGVYFANDKYVAIQFFAVYADTASVTFRDQPATTAGKYYGSVIVTSLSIEAAVAAELRKRDRLAPKKSTRSGVQAPASGRRKKPEA